jgi:hypothetical protein
VRYLLLGVRALGSKDLEIGVKGGLPIGLERESDGVVICFAMIRMVCRYLQALWCRHISAYRYAYDGISVSVLLLAVKESFLGSLSFSGTSLFVGLYSDVLQE